jgi:serine/threonine protein kinase
MLEGVYGTPRRPSSAHLAAVPQGPVHVPSWARALDPSVLPLRGPVRLNRISGSPCVILATSFDRRTSVVLKLISAPQAVSQMRSDGEILRSIRRAGEIRAAHYAFTKLLDIREVPGYGFVTLSEYAGVGIAYQQMKALTLDRLLAISIRVLDALDHIHRNSSMHGDICQANLLIHDSGDVVVLDYDLSDHNPEFRRTHYPQSHIRSGTLSAWKAADMRVFVALMIKWLEKRHGNLCINPTSVAEQEAASIRRLVGRIAAYAPKAAYHGATEISAHVSHMIRQAV